VSVRILIGDCRERMAELPDASVHCCVTSPPYFGLRDYGVEGQMGLEPTPDEFVAGMVEVFREVRRALRDDGTLWLNLGDSYASSPPGNKTMGVSGKSGLNGVNGASGKYRETLEVGHATKRDTSKLPGLKPKDLIGIPWRVAFALQADGWYLRQDIIWSKPNPMPESVRDRCTKGHEYIFLLSKSPRYYFDSEAIAEESAYPGDERHLRTDKTIEFARPDGGSRARTAKPTGDTRNKRSVWTVATQPFSGAHFATYPPALIEPCIKAGCPAGGVVLDPFGGAGTTGLVADRLQRDAILIELNPKYAEIARKRIAEEGGIFAEVRAA
jgi:DNA modification methylase